MKMTTLVITLFPYTWHVRSRFPERFGQPCAVTARGTMNSCRLVFEDGFTIITSRNYIRKRKDVAVKLQTGAEDE